MDAFLKALKEIYLSFEKKMKKRKNKKATIPNLIESDRKGGELSTVIYMNNFLICETIIINYLGFSIGPFSSNHLLKPPTR